MELIWKLSNDSCTYKTASLPPCEGWVPLSWNGYQRLREQIIFWIACFSFLAIDHLLREAGWNLGCDSFYFVNYFWALFNKKSKAVSNTIMGLHLYCLNNSVYSFPLGKNPDFPCFGTKFLAWVLEVKLQLFLNFNIPYLAEVLLNDCQRLVWNDEVIFQGMRPERKNPYMQGFASFKEKNNWGGGKKKKLNERLSCSWAVAISFS